LMVTAMWFVLRPGVPCGICRSASARGVWSIPGFAAGAGAVCGPGCLGGCVLAPGARAICCWSRPVL
jgi:hypothetical protein